MDLLHNWFFHILEEMEKRRQRENTWINPYSLNNNKLTMNKKETLLQKIEELKKEVETLDKEEILVPDCIKFVDFYDWFWIVNWKSLLRYSNTYNIWRIIESEWRKLIKPKLIKCRYEDLIPWEFFFDWEELDEDYLENLRYYNLKLEEWYQYWNWKDCRYSNNCSSNAIVYKAVA